MKIKRREYYISAIYAMLNIPRTIIKTATQGKLKRGKKDTVFIMGSGYSVNDISNKEWKRIEKVGDTIAFNSFFKCKKVNINYHIIREAGYELYGDAGIVNYLKDCNQNPKYKKTKYLICMHPINVDTNILMCKYKKLVKNKYFYYFNKPINRGYYKPAKSINKIAHLEATLFDAINIASVMKYKKIVLIGIDLYDARYFFLKKNDTKLGLKIKNIKSKDVHRTAKPILKHLEKWNKIFKKDGIQMYIYNPKSLLNKFLPTYKLPKKKN